jgi:PPOX class probable F420-dependent enzyme
LERDSRIMRTEGWVEILLRRARIAHLATSTRKGLPHVVPICFAYDGRVIYSSIDNKPKQVEPARMRRVRNITENKSVSLVVDAYSENWERLRYVIIDGDASMLYSGAEHRRAILLLRRKYRQYRSMRLEERPIIRIEPIRSRAWRATARLV